MSEQGASEAARETALAPGLYFVATPIGTARDITLRGLDILASADAILAEDTRTARRLLELHGIPLRGRPLIAYHDHNGAKVRPQVLDRLGRGEALVYVSEAGTPLVADPGYQLGRDARAAGYKVTAAPGPSAVLAALVVSGLPTDRFFFAGFAPASAGARRTWAEEIGSVPGTIVFFDTAPRLSKTLSELAGTWGERRIAVCRELTKRFEEVIEGTLEDVLTELSGRSLKGEIVVVVDRAKRMEVSPEDVEAALREAMQEQPVKGAASAVAEAFGLGRRDVYQLALKLKSER